MGWNLSSVGTAMKREVTQVTKTNSLVFPHVTVEFYESEITEEMRYNWNKFWRLLVARVLKESEPKRNRSKVKTKTKKSPKVTL